MGVGAKHGGICRKVEHISPGIGQALFGEQVGEGFGVFHEV